LGIVKAKATGLIKPDPSKNRVYSKADDFVEKSGKIFPAIETDRKKLGT